MIIAAIVILAVIGIIFACYARCVKNLALDFKQSVNTLGLPIVTLTSNGKKFNFLVDTGSNLSHLKLGVAEQMNSKPVDDKIKGGTITTGNGEVQQYGYYEVIFDFEGKFQLNQIFEIMDLEDTFSGWGIPVHGILGVDFLRTNGYKLNFKSAIMHI